MNLLDQIRISDKKPKELLVYLSKKVKNDKTLLKDIPQCFKAGSPVEKGICMEVLEHVSLERPELVIPYINYVIDYLDYDAPRVKWEAARVIANLAKKYPDQAAKAVDTLLVNTKDAGTVVRWSTAFALGEIAKHHASSRGALVRKMDELVKKEANNGVRNVYLKALKVIKK